MKKITILIAAFFVLGLQAQKKEKIAFGPYIQQMSPKDATICWSTLESQPTITDSEGVVKPVREYKHHRIVLGNLKPDSEYSYDILNDGSSEGKGKFTTYPKKASPFNFVVIGDTRSRHDVYAKILKMSMDKNPRFLINTGDLVGNGRDIGDWEAFLKVSREFMRNIPYYPVLGNHEKDSPYYYDLFDLPNNERYYYFTVGDALFIILDSEGIHESTPAYIKNREKYWTDSGMDYDIEQKKWLEKVLNLHNEAGFIFVFQHLPLYSIMKDRVAESTESREFWGDIFERHGVQAFINGHDHHYHHAIKNNIHYITAAGGGAPLYDFDAIQKETVKYSKIEHFINIEVEKEKAVLHVIDINGNEIDTIVIKRRNPNKSKK